MAWLVVQFGEDNTVEVVPNTWYMKKESKCYWPPECTAKNIIIDFIRKRHVPEKKWLLYEATILGSYGKVSNMNCLYIISGLSFNI